MNSKYNTYDHLDKLKCIENEEIIKIDKKFENFSIDNNYNYAINLVENRNVLPNVNIDFFHYAHKFSINFFDIVAFVNICINQVFK